MYNSVPSTPPPSYEEAMMMFCSSQEKLTGTESGHTSSTFGVDYGEDRLVTACRNNDLNYLTNNPEELRRCIDCLYENKKEDSRIEESVSLLHVACFENNPQVVKLLLEQGADPNIKLPKSGLTPIELACADRQMDPEILSMLAGYLFPHRLDVNAFHCVRSRGYPEDFTLLQLACHSQNIQAITTLLANQADPNLATTDWDASPLHILFHGQPNEQALQILLAAEQININATTSEGVTPLMFACQNHAELAHLLLMNDRVDVHAEDCLGRQAVHYAAQSDHETVIKALLEKEADVNAKTTKGVTPLHLAVIGKCDAVIDVLLDHGADTTTKAVFNPFPLIQTFGTCLCLILTCPTLCVPMLVCDTLEKESSNLPIHERQITRYAQSCCPVRYGLSPMELADEELQARMERRIAITSQPGSLSNPQINS